MLSLLSNSSISSKEVEGSVSRITKNLTLRLLNLAGKRVQVEQSINKSACFTPPYSSTLEPPSSHPILIPSFTSRLWRS